MNRWRLIIFMYLLLSPLVSGQQRGFQSEILLDPSGKARKGEHWLLVIGIDRYLFHGWLQTAVRDARRVQELLNQRYHFEHTIQLYDHQATREGIINAFQSLSRKVKKDDSLVIFYAGHGNLDESTNSGSWIPVDGEEHKPATWISNVVIKNYLRVDSIKAKHILLVSDSCFSGDLFRDTGTKVPDKNHIRRAYNLPSRQVLTSGNLEPVSDNGFRGHSVFSHFLLDVLERNDKAHLVLSDVFPVIREGVADNSPQRQVPRYGPLTQIGGTSGGELVFFMREDAPILERQGIIVKKKEELAFLEEFRRKQRLLKETMDDEQRRMDLDIEELEKKIADLRKDLGKNKQKGSKNLDGILKMIEEQEQREAALAKLRMERELKEQQLKKEMARLRKEKVALIKKETAPEIAKYNTIVSTKYRGEYEKEAWVALLEHFPDDWIEGVKIGDVDSLVLSPEERRAAKEEKAGFGFVAGIKEGFLAIITRIGGSTPFDDAKTSFMYCLGHFLGMLIFGVLTLCCLFFLSSASEKISYGFGEFLGGVAFIYILCHLVFMLIVFFSYF